MSEERAEKYEHVAVSELDQEVLHALFAQGWSQHKLIFLMTPGRPNPGLDDHPLLHVLRREHDEPRMWTKREIQKIAADTLGIGLEVTRA